MTARLPSFRQQPADYAKDRARLEALVELATVIGCLPAEGTEENIRFGDQMGMWTERLRIFAPEQVRAGCELAALEWTFNGMPPLGFIAERIRRVAGIYQPETQKDAIEDEASKAWASVRRKIRTCGPYFDPELTKEERYAVDSIGGWDRLCLASSKDLDFLAKDFTRYYAIGKKDPAAISKTKSIGLDNTILGIPIIDASGTLQ